MFDKSKIFLNHIRASNSTYSRSNSLLKEISLDVLDRVDKPEGKSICILDIWSRSSYIFEAIREKQLKINYIETLSHKNVLSKNKNKIVSSLSLPFKEDSFDYCFCILSMGSAEEIITTFKKIYDLLKKNGKFICVFHGEDHLKEFRDSFLNFFPHVNENSFCPYIDITSLGKIGNAAGFKNIVIDKNNFYLDVKYASDIWNFIRNIGDGNILELRENKYLGKEKFLSFCKKIEEGANNTYYKNTLSYNFFTATK